MLTKFLIFIQPIDFARFLHLEREGHLDLTSLEKVESIGQKIDIKTKAI